MSDQVYLTILRLLHICFGIFWAGTAIYLAYFVEPAVRISGPAGTRVMQQLAKTNGFPVIMTLSAVITVVAGALLIWKLSGGLQSQWLTTTNGMVLSSGAGLAIIAFFIGFSVNRPAGIKIAKIGNAIATAGGQPTAEQMAEINKLTKKLSGAGRVVAFLLVITIIGMSVFRYL